MKKAKNLHHDNTLAQIINAYANVGVPLCTTSFIVLLGIVAYGIIQYFSKNIFITSDPFMLSLMIALATFCFIIFIPALIAIIFGLIPEMFADWKERRRKRTKRISA